VKRWLLAAGALVLVAALAAGAFVGGYAGTRAIRRHLEVTTPPAPTPSALASATLAPASSTSSGGGLPASPAAVAAALRSLVTASALGGRLTGAVVDVLTGEVLYARSASTAVAPASTAKLMTAAAVLLTRGAQFRITTSVVTDGSGTITLVGAGDPTLTAAAAGAASAYAGAARLSDLAAQVRATNVPVRRIVVDDALYTGPSTSPAWSPDDIPSSYAAPITAVMADGARDAPTSTIRSRTPDVAAGHDFAALLGKASVPVTRGIATPAMRTVAAVQSAPISTLVSEMLQTSDNVIAESLARQVAIATHAPVSFTGAAGAIRSVLGGARVDPGAGMVDGSGLAATDRVSTSVLASVLRLAAGDAHPDLHDLLTGLPVAGWSGTLGDRYLSGSAAAGAGTVRAKTGTLTGVSSLAGLVHDVDGRLLAFAFDADRVTAGNDVADAALDAIAAALARCGCH